MKIMYEKLEPGVKKFIKAELKNLLTIEGKELEDETLLEAEQLGLTGDTSSIKPEYLSKKIIPVVFAQSICSQFFQLVNMPASTYAVPRLSYTRESTTAEVAENGQIKTAKISTSNITMTAVKYAIRSILTKEALEDAEKVGFDILRRVMEYDVKSIINELDQKVVALMKLGAAAGDVWWDVNIPASWSDSHPALEYDQTLYDSLVEAVKAVAVNKFAANFMLINPSDIVRVVKLKFFRPAEPDTSLQGELGTILNLGVFSSLNSESGMFFIGEKKTIGMYGSYIPMQYNAGGYNAEYDKQDWNVRTRAAMMITQGEALARVVLYDNYTNEDVTITGGAGQAAHAPINSAKTLTAKDGDGSTALTIITYDSRTEAKPTSSDANTIILDLETGAITTSSSYTPTGGKITLTAYSARV
ncbi:MAG: hypothetical protein ACTSVB_05610 [Candidatus Heimdallarchaeaceae archaeon]